MEVCRFRLAVTGILRSRVFRRLFNKKRVNSRGRNYLGGGKLPPPSKFGMIGTPPKLNLFPRRTNFRDTLISATRLPQPHLVFVCVFSPMISATVCVSGPFSTMSVTLQGGGG